MIMCDNENNGAKKRGGKLEVTNLISLMKANFSLTRLR
jgi:hypothetical protein